MGKDSKIEWTHHTFNPWWGCVKVSEACKHCYAEAWAERVGQMSVGLSRIVDSSQTRIGNSHESGTDLRLRKVFVKESSAHRWQIFSKTEKNLYRGGIGWVR